jgi:hypothetical protein
MGFLGSFLSFLSSFSSAYLGWRCWQLRFVRVLEDVLIAEQLGWLF